MFVQRALLLITLSSLVACDRSAPPAADPAPHAEAAPAAPPAEPTAEAAPDAPIQDWDKLLAAEPRWREAYEQSEIDAPVLKGLIHTKPGAVVTIVYGSWCGDSLREVPPLMNYLLHVKELPFQWSAINVSRAFASPVDLSSLDIGHVPTIIVTRDGKEVGRIVESAPNGAAQDLLSLLDGSTTGVISTRDDL
jgi:thiol-disulfide isomerase/thioredoxin